MKHKTTEKFIEQAKHIHGDKYTYGKSEYIDDRHKIIITCPIHGDFEQRPSHHLSGEGCPKCAIEKSKSLICGEGINDLELANNTECYKSWHRMIVRCHSTKPCYRNCRVSKDWLKLSEFKKWFDSHYVKGWHLDKDILSKGDKLYSADTCCFVPSEINNMFSSLTKSLGNELPIGVSKTPCGHYRVRVYRDGKDVNLGTYIYIDTALVVYNSFKLDIIRSLANKYKSDLEPRVYSCLYNYKINSQYGRKKD